MNFVAIDFETANERRCSPCALGVAVVQNGEITKKKSWLIRPKELYFNPFNVQIHGITQQDVKNEPELPDLWREIAPYLEGQFILAHNASFDMSVLRHTLAAYHLPFPGLSYCCTCMIAKSAWPELPSFRLDVVSRRLDIQFAHHDALEDAVACAKVALHAAEKAGAATISALSSALGIVPGKLTADGYKPPQAKRLKAKRPKVKRPKLAL